MRKIVILEMKEIQSENFTHYIKYEDRLFWFNPVIIEAFRHKTQNVYLFSNKTDYKYWFLKNSGRRMTEDLSIYLDNHLNSINNNKQIKIVQDELDSIKI